jgi:hypothetical protein
MLYQPILQFDYFWGTQHKYQNPWFSRRKWGIIWIIGYLSTCAKIASSYSPHFLHIHRFAGIMQNRDSSERTRLSKGGCSVQKSFVNWTCHLCWVFVNFWQCLDGRNLNFARWWSWLIVVRDIVSVYFSVIVFAIWRSEKVG